MLELLKTKLLNYPNEQARYNYLREYLQLYILKILDEKGYFQRLAFVGGTALRIIYDLKRFSEDLDFSLIDTKAFPAKQLAENIARELKLINCDVTVKCKVDKTVAVIWFKFPQLLSALGLSPHQTQLLSIKMEIDQNPPQGFNTIFTVINKEFLIAINHYDLPSLFASKLHAFLFRKYRKGRDYYDLLWYLSRKVIPNYRLLNEAIIQTQHRDLKLNAVSLKHLLEEQINQTNFKHIALDVEAFLEDSNESRFFTKEFFLQALAS